MSILRTIVQIIAVLAILMGLLWIGQGLGLIMWPRESFMLADRRWAANGAILAAAGLIILVTARRVGR